MSNGARLDIDLSAIAANWRSFRDIGAAEASAVVKSDAYGCGAENVAPALAAAGCQTFFVATLAEALRLASRLTGEQKIYVLNGFAEPSAWPEDPRVRPVLNTLNQVRAWAERGEAAAWRQPPAALQIETGMNRLGLTEAEQSALGEQPALPEGAIELIMSHLASAEGPQDPMLIAQNAAFKAAASALKARFPQARLSLSATAGALQGSDFAYDLIRPGVGLYGGLPFAAARPAVKLSAPLLRVWRVEAGERSGYGGDWIATRRSRLATAPLGYADGLRRSIAGRWRARIGGVEAPLAGRVSMDLIVLDVTDLDPAPKEGDRAWLLDESLTIDAMAAAADTIGYEILTGLDAARRLERRVNPV